MSRHDGRWITIIACLMVSWAGPVQAQQDRPIRFEGDADSPAQRRFLTVLERGAFSRIETDSVLGTDVRMEGDLLILGADVRLAGTVSGDIIAVDSDLFLRPGARVEGSVVVLGGGFYSSQRAEIEGDVVYRPDEKYAIERRPDEVRIVLYREPPETLTLHGLSGIKLPTYQRVDEWTFAYGATLRPFAWRWEPSLEAVVRFKTEHGDLEATIRQAWRPNRSLTFGAELERATRTRDDWMRSDAANSLAFLFAGDDLRNYYEADRLAVFLRGSAEARWAPRLEMEVEDAKSLVASEQFVIFGSDPQRPNPAIDEGTVAALRIGATHRRIGTASELSADAVVEFADGDVAGDFTYVLADLDVGWKGRGPDSHGLEARLMARRDLSGTLPRQRWSSVGGLATLPTEPELGRRGTRLLFAELTYLVPIESVQLAMAGSPSAFGRIAVGDAWSEGSDVDLEMNLIAGLRFSAFELGVAIDPTDDGAVDSPAGSAGPPDSSGPTVFVGLRL